MISHAHPCSDTGKLDTELQNVSSKVDSKAESHEVHSLQNEVASLRQTTQQLTSDVEDLRYQLEVLRETSRSI